MEPLLFRGQSYTEERLTEEVARTSRNKSAAYQWHQSSCYTLKFLHAHCMLASCRKLLLVDDTVLLIFDGVFEKRRKLRLCFCSIECQRKHYVSLQVKKRRSDKATRGLNRELAKHERELLMQGNPARALQVGCSYAGERKREAIKARYRGILTRELSRAQQKGDLSRYRAIRAALDQLDTI